MIAENLIFLNQEENSRESVVRKLISNAHALGYVSDPESYRDAVMAREELIPTSVGFNVAIPHGRDSGVNKPFITFMKTKEEFLWDDKNNENVDFIFMIGIPEENQDNLHLKYLAAISRKLMNEDFRAALRNSENVKEAYDLLDEINNLI